jgi:hypothetical protein
MTPQTVGDIANLIVRFYLEAAGYYYGTHGVSTQPGFNAYWAAHRDRSYSASWFAVRLLRARGEHAAERRRAVLADVAKLPVPDRQWTLLWLAVSHADFYGRSSLISDSQLVQICREIGRADLLQMLAGRVSVRDPDLQPRQGVNNFPYSYMVYAVLQHSEQLLDSGDSAELLRDESAQRILSRDPVITGWWAIAAARLDRVHAGTILHAALPRFSESAWGTDRARIVAALWELGSTSEKRFVLDWFYREPLDGCCVTPRRMFLESVAAAPGGWRRLASFVADPRFDSLDWLSLDTLVRIVNQRSSTPIISDDLYREAQHPYWIGTVENQMERAMKEYPRETQKLLAVLEQWRRRIRASAPIWGRAGPPWRPPME